MNRRLFSTLREPTDPGDHELRLEREQSSIPLSRSPFESVQQHDAMNQAVETRNSEELAIRIAAEVPWSDLLLEIAMTTAFSSLTDGTPILTAQNLASYLCFFLLVWWVWASQVAYNMRFRQADWLHRFYVFLQLMVFGGLAAFTNKFDITEGLAPKDKFDAIDSMLASEGFDQSAISAAHYRHHRLPNLNTRGASVTFGISRLLLLLQYAVVFYHAKGRKRTALWVHIASLSFSAMCYFGTYVLLKVGTDAPYQIGKLVLWYLPLAVEVAAHFFSNELSGRVDYSPEAVYSRSATLFIIILGGGLDKITHGFQFIVGNVGLGKGGSGLMFCAALIIVSEFGLYFGSSQNKKPGNHRALAWFFSHVFYLSALIITLQAMAVLLTYTDISKALNHQLSFSQDFEDFFQNNPGVNISVNDFPQATKDFAQMGLSFDLFVEKINEGVEKGKEQNNTAIPTSYLLQGMVNIIYNILQEFNADPASDSLVGLQINAFISADPTNTTVITESGFVNIFNGIVRKNANPALWFFAAGGGTLVTLALMGLIKRVPRDRWEWGVVSSRLLLGLGIMSLSPILDMGYNAPILDSDQQLVTNSKIWLLADTFWILPPFALALAIQQVIEFVLLYLAKQRYGHQSSDYAAEEGVNFDDRNEKPQVLHYTSMSLTESPPTSNFSLDPRSYSDTSRLIGFGWKQHHSKYR